MTKPAIGARNWKRKRAKVMAALAAVTDEAEMIRGTVDIAIARERASNIAVNAAKATNAFYQLVAIIEMHEE